MKTKKIKYRTWDGEKFIYWGFIDGQFIAPPKDIKDAQAFIHIQDKYDKDIYEGDIIEIPWLNYKKQTAKVIWDDGGNGTVGWSYQVQFNKVVGGIHRQLYNTMESPIFSECRVTIIGNIFESPEKIKMEEP